MIELGDAVQVKDHPAKIVGVVKAIRPQSWAPIRVYFTEESFADYKENEVIRINKMEVILRSRRMKKIEEVDMLEI